MKCIVLFTAALSIGFGVTGYGRNTPAPKKVASAPGTIFPLGNQAPARNFTGTVYLYPLIKDDATFNAVGGSVAFTLGARSHWHTHPPGQILLITEGLGYYQEEGQPLRLLRKGEVVQCQPNVKHWHGASPKQGMTHISLNVNSEKGIVSWEQPVTDAEYNSFK